MIVLDTNVVGEMMAARPNPRVVHFLDSLETSAALTAVTVAELRYGAAILASGRRKQRLCASIDQLVESLGPVLSLDVDGAAAYADIASDRRRRGRPISQFDALIAAICLVHGAALATRDAGGFEHTGIAVVNPWSA